MQGHAAVVSHSFLGADGADALQLTASNCRKLDGRLSRGWSFLASAAPVVWLAIGTIQKFSGNHRAGVLLPRIAAPSAKPDEPCRPIDPRLRATEQSGRRRSNRVLPKCSR